MHTLCLRTYLAPHAASPCSPHALAPPHPQGVVLTQRNATHYAEQCLRPVFRLGFRDRVLQSFSTAFDAAFEEIWLAFSAGATLVVATSEMMKSGADLVDTIRELRITVLDTTPTNLGILGAPEELPLVHTVIVGGEACPGHIVDAWQPGRRFLNTYGPTETTVVATWAELFAGEPVTIGKGMPNYLISVRDPESLLPVEPGDEGELLIGGPGVAQGYLNLPEKTREKFVSLDGSGRCYRSGDLVREDVEGGLIYLGRADAQVKIRGYRVELEDIETHLTRVGGSQAVVVAVQLKTESDAQELVAENAALADGDAHILNKSPYF